MPCPGPDIDQEQIDNAVNDIMELLYTKYKITRPEDICKFDWEDGRFVAERAGLVKRLRDVVGKIFVDDAVMTF